jgi:hypothetical protein
VITVRTTYSNINSGFFLFVLHSSQKKTAIISTNSINQHRSLNWGRGCVLSEEGTDFLKYYLDEHRTQNN